MDIKLAQQLMALNNEIINQENIGGKFVEGKDLAGLISVYTKSLGDAHPELVKLSKQFNSIPENQDILFSYAVNSLSLMGEISKATRSIVQYEVAKNYANGLASYNVANTEYKGAEFGNDNNRLKSFSAPVLDGGIKLS
jgi:hypothetical protein